MLAAWLLALWGPKMPVGGTVLVSGWVRPVPADWPALPDTVISHAQFGREQIWCTNHGARVSGPEPRRSYALASTSTTMVGWPFRAAEYTVSQSLFTTQAVSPTGVLSVRNVPWKAATGLAVPRWLPVSIARTGSFRRLPTQVLWGGLLADASVYASLLFVIAGAARCARGAHRRARARCAGCGYDVSGSLERCPECGKPFASAAA